MSPPLVSVITPCYNGSRWIRDALESVRHSTYPHLEHIVVDDGSTDGSTAVLVRLQREYGFVLLELPANGGLARARNAAIARSHGKYLFPLDCDNRLPPKHLEILVAAAETAGTGFSPFYADVIRFGTLEQRVESPPWSLERLLQGPFIDAGCLFSRRAFDAVGGFDPACTLWEDHEFFLAMALKGFRGLRVPDTAFLYCLREDSMSDHFNRRGGNQEKQKVRAYIERKHARALQQLARVEPIEPKIQPVRQARLARSPGTQEMQNQASSNAGSDFPEEKLHQRPFPFLSFLPPDARSLLEFGCENDGLCRQFRQMNPDCYYIGVTDDTETAKALQGKLDRAIAGDLDRLRAEHLGIDALDCILYRDRLSCIADLEATLQRHAAWLREGGQAVALFPNFLHWQRWIRWLRGEEEEAGGSFFPIERVRSVFERAGLQIYQTRFWQASEPFPERPELFDALSWETGLDRDRLKRQMGPESYIVRAFKSAVPARPILIQTMLMGPRGCDSVRVYEPNAFSATLPGVRVNATVGHAIDPSVAEGHTLEKIFVCQRPILEYPKDLNNLRELLRCGYLIVTEMDDNPEPYLPYAQNRYLSFRGCHAVQTSTEMLAGVLGKYNPYVAVFANQIAYLPPPPDRKFRAAGDRISIFFGALNRERDWQPILPVLNQIAWEMGDRLAFQVIHDRRFFDALETPHKAFRPFCSYNEYRAVLDRCDIGLLPLLPGRHNQAKSDLKFLEHAAHGTVAIASPTVYEASIRDGETGLIYRDTVEFERQLHQLLADVSLRHRIAANAYGWVKKNRLLRSHYRERQAWYLQMLDRLPELNRALRERVPELFGERVPELFGERVPELFVDR